MNLTWLWVAILYAGAVALARRAGIELPRRVAALFYLLVLIFFFRPMTGPWVNVATDVLQLLPPWSASAPPGLDKFTVSNLQQGDVPMQLVPWAHQVREAWRSLRIPIWNELTGTGFPLLSNGQGGALSPIRILALPLALAHSITAEGALKVLIALTFTFLYARRRELSIFASIIAAISYGFGPFLIVWLHFAQATVAAFLPTVIYLLDRLAEQQTYGRLVAAAVIVPVVLFSGHPDTASQMALFATAYVVWIVVVERPAGWRRAFAAIALAGVIGVVLALPFIVPFLEALPHGFRYGMIEDAPRTAIPYSDFPSLLLLAQPRYFGTIPQHQVWGPAHAESITGFAGILGIAGGFLLLADVVMTRRVRTRQTFFLIAATAIFGVLANFGPLVRAIHSILPLGSHARMRFLFAFTLAIAAAILVDRLRSRSPAALVALGAAAVVVVAIFARMDIPTAEWRSIAFQGAACSAAVIGVAMFLALRKGTMVVAALLLVALLGEMWLVTRRWNPVMPVESFYPRTPLVDAVDRSHQRSRDRVVGIGPPLFPNTNLLFGLEDVRILDAMAPWRYARLLHEIMPSYDLNDYFVKWQEPDNRLLDYLNVRWVMTEEGRDLTDRQRFRPLYHGPDGRLFENLDVLPRFFTVRNVLVESDTARFTERIRNHSDWKSTAIVRSMPVRTDRERNDLLAPRPANSPEAVLQITRSAPTAYEMTVTAPRHTLVVSSIGWWKWWRAEIDSRRAETFPVNGAFVGFIVPPGSGTVTVRYVPVSLYLSFAVALLTSITLVVIAARRR